MGKITKPMALALLVGLAAWGVMANTSPAAQSVNPNIQQSVDQGNINQRRTTPAPSQLNPAAESRDPHWRPSPGSSGGTPATCEGVDLVMDSITARRVGNNIMINGTFKNRCTGALPRGVEMLFEVIGGGSQVSGGGNQIVWAGEEPERQITVKVTVNYRNRVAESNYTNNWCSVILARGQVSSTSGCR